MNELKVNDEVIVNYTAGPATVRLVLGATGVAISKILNSVKIIYAIRYTDGTEKYFDQTEELRDLFNTLTRTA